MNIILGRAPDFVMKLGQVEIFHKICIDSLPPMAINREFYVFSDRSLWTVSNMARGFFEGKRHQFLRLSEYRSVQQTGEFVVYFQDVCMSLAIPVGLLHKDRARIQNAFLDLVERLKTLS